MAADGQHGEINPVIRTPGLQPLSDFGDGQDVGADLPGDGGQVGVLLLQLHEVMKLGWNQHTKTIRSESGH